MTPLIARPLLLPSQSGKFNAEKCFKLGAIADDDDDQDDYNRTMCLLRRRFLLQCAKSHIDTLADNLGHKMSGSPDPSLLQPPTLNLSLDHNCCL